MFEDPTMSKPDGIKSGKEGENNESVKEKAINKDEDGHTFLYDYSAMVNESGMRESDVKEILKLIPASSEIGPIQSIKGGHEKIKSEEGNFKTVGWEEDENKARVMTGIPLTPKGGNIYNFERIDGKWKIASDSRWMS